MNEFAMFMKTHHGVSLARDEARDKYKYDDAQMYWECWNAAQQSVQPTAFGAGGRGLLANLLVSLGKYLVKIGGG
jgi:hypothetical protein